MGRLILSEVARTDLVEIWQHIASDNVDAADRIIDRIYGNFAMLVENPEAGRLRPELAAEVRSFSTGAGSYIVFYRIADDDVQIVRVLHGARDIPSALN